MSLLTHRAHTQAEKIPSHQNLLVCFDAGNNSGASFFNKGEVQDLSCRCFPCFWKRNFQSRTAIMSRRGSLDLLNLVHQFVRTKTDLANVSLLRLRGRPTREMCVFLHTSQQRNQNPKTCGDTSASTAPLCSGGHRM